MPYFFNSIPQLFALRLMRVQGCGPSHSLPAYGCNARIGDRPTRTDPEAKVQDSSGLFLPQRFPFGGNVGEIGQMETPGQAVDQREMNSLQRHINRWVIGKESNQQKKTSHAQLLRTHDRRSTPCPLPLRFLAFEVPRRSGYSRSMLPKPPKREHSTRRPRACLRQFRSLRHRRTLEPDAVSATIGSTYKQSGYRKNRRLQGPHRAPLPMIRLRSAGP